MCDRLAHRGPDAYGEYYDTEVALGHRRLSIIDVEGGAQPLGNEDGSLQIVFNGEIYNYRELRRGLAARGHRFRTESDTEVLVHLYEEEGERLPELLNGMFAFAIWDSRRRELFLARDRMGKKPLYYCSGAAPTDFAFASELKALAAIPGFRTAVSARAFADFLALGYVPEPDCIFQSVHKLPPAHWMRVGAQGARFRRYWRPVFAAGADRKFGDTVEELRALAEDAVSRRMISDVPLGAFLSGGVDSSAVVACMARQSARPVQTFTIGFTARAFDETRFARQVAARYRTDHREQTVTPAVEEVIGTLVEHFDEPFGDSSAIPTLYLAEMTRRHVTVALSGDGADEVFGGYRRYLHGAVEQRLRALLPDWFRRSVVRFGAAHYPKFDFLPRPFRARTVLANLAGEMADACFRSSACLSDAGVARVLAPGLLAQLNGYLPSQRFREQFAAVRHLAPLEQMQAVDFETYLPGDILVKVDRATMAHSLEARSPWLDYRMIELAGTVPPSWKLHGHTGKHIFKTTFASYLPDGVTHRHKMGFAVPLGVWLRSSLKGLFEKFVFRTEMECFLSLPAVRKMWAEHQSGVRNHDRALWNLLIAAMWHNRWVAGLSPSTPLLKRTRNTSTIVNSAF